jgi:riboflavin kinase / FMN adenylyltransferase
MGVEQLVLLPFDQTLANLTPQAFVKTILIEGLEARFISVGQDFHFGRGRVGTSADLDAIASSYGTAVRVVPLHCAEDERISSSSIRQALELGKVARANALLGRAYTLVGEVVQGQQIGRTIGFPTANLKVPDDKFLPQRGVYAVQVSCSDWGSTQPGVMNLGVRPTVDGLRQTIEVHLLNWSGDLYGKTLTVALETFLRPEQKFDSLEALTAQIQTDCAIAQSLFATPQV